MAILWNHSNSFDLNKQFGSANTGFDAGTGWQGLNPLHAGDSGRGNPGTGQAEDPPLCSPQAGLRSGFAERSLLGREETADHALRSHEDARRPVGLTDQ